MTAQPATSAASNVVIQGKGLGKSYGTTWALRSIDIEVRSGEVVALFGANGAGKSTLIRLLATLAAPSLGSLRILGYDTTRQSRAVRGAIGLVSHQTYLYADLTPEENLALYAEMYRLDQIPARIKKCLEAVGLSPVAGRRVRELSRGMQQRLALARAVLHEPAVLLLDEPDSGLDEGGTRCLAQLIEAGSRRGQAVVMSTHRLELGLALCHRVLVLARGKIAYSAPVGAHPVEAWREIYSQIGQAGLLAEAGQVGQPGRATVSTL